MRNSVGFQSPKSKRTFLSLVVLVSVLILPHHKNELEENKEKHAEFSIPKRFTPPVVSQSTLRVP